MDVFLTEIKREVAKELDMSQEAVENVLRTAFDKIGDHLAKGEKVYLVNFFNLFPKDYKEKQVRNPKTGDPMVIPPYRTVSCRPTKQMKRKLDSALKGRDV